METLNFNKLPFTNAQLNWRAWLRAVAISFGLGATLFGLQACNPQFKPYQRPRSSGIAVPGLNYRQDTTAEFVSNGPSAQMVFRVSDQGRPVATVIVPLNMIDFNSRAGSGAGQSPLYTYRVDVRCNTGSCDKFVAVWTVSAASAANYSWYDTGNNGVQTTKLYVMDPDSQPTEIRSELNSGYPTADDAYFALVAPIGY